MVAGIVVSFVWVRAGRGRQRRALSSSTKNDLEYMKDTSSRQVNAYTGRNMVVLCTTEVC
jgi:hypothetical protein